MTHWSDEKANVPAAVRHRLLRISKAKGITFDAVAVRYVTERLLYRLSNSPHADRFVLKGAWLFYLWDIARRTTRDVDFLGYGENSVEHLTAVVHEVSQLEVSPDDGLTFDPTSIDSQPLHEEEEYSGVRVRITAHLGTARIRAQIDVGFGEALIRDPLEADLPVLLDYPQPRLRAYHAEASIAEKLEAMVRFGARNDRMKDYFDLFILSREQRFEGRPLVDQIFATFSRRATALPSEVPPGLSDVFAAEREQDWIAFLRSSGGEAVPDAFPDVVSHVRRFVAPPLLATQRRDSFGMVWTPETGWAERG